MTALLEVSKLDAWYGPTQVLHGLDFNLEPGSIATLLGANGAGKTTTLRTISGLLHARQGTVELDGADITKVDPQITTRRISAAQLSPSPVSRRETGRCTPDVSSAVATPRPR